jgi:E3 ubiquitin-protein ligase LRSAM1
LEDEKYQRNAFAALYMKQDSRNKELCHQVEQIQSELASLTMVEMTKKDLKVEFENDVMREKRETLSQMLMTLMEQKDDRQAELKLRLDELEKNKNEETDNYWLIQYQKLLDAKPKVLLNFPTRWCVPIASCIVLSLYVSRVSWTLRSKSILPSRTC